MVIRSRFFDGEDEKKRAVEPLSAGAGVGPLASFFFDNYVKITSDFVWKIGCQDSVINCEGTSAIKRIKDDEQRIESYLHIMFYSLDVKVHIVTIGVLYMRA